MSLLDELFTADSEFTIEGDWVKDIKELYEQYGLTKSVQNLEPAKLRKYLEFRLMFLQEELDEAKTALASNDPENAEDIVDAMIDLCVVAIGTLDNFGVDAYEAWARVNDANKNKQVGIKANRPNPLGLPDLTKPLGWTAPTHVDNVGLLPKVFNGDPV